MGLERGFVSSSLALTPGDMAEYVEAVVTDRMEIEAAEILAALSHSTKRDTVAFAAKWGCKGKRVRNRVSSSESPHSDVGLHPVDPVHSGSDLAEDQATVHHPKIQVASTAVVIESTEAEQNAKFLNKNNNCAASYASNGVLALRQNVMEAEKETCRLHRTLTNKESDCLMIRERQILSSIVGIPEKDIWEDSQQDQITGNNALIKSVKTEQNAESIKSSPTCATKYMSRGGRRSRQNLTEAEKEARRLRRILANRESARQTIRRRQAICEKLTLKVAGLTRENENLKRTKEFAVKEYQSQESINKHLKAEMAKAIKLGEQKALAESSHSVQSHYGHQGIFVPSSISTPNNGRLGSSHDQENPVNINDPKTPLYVVSYPWFFSLPDHQNGLQPQPSCSPNDIEDEGSVNNQFSAGCSLKSVVHEEKYNSSLPKEVEIEAYRSTEANPSNLNCTPVRLPPDGGGQCISYHIKEEVLASTPLSLAGTTLNVVEQENTPDHVVKTEVVPIRECHYVGALQEENKVLDALAATEARKRRKELTKQKNLHGRQCRLHR